MKDTLKQELWDNNDTVLGPGFHSHRDTENFSEKFYFGAVWNQIK